MAIGNLQKMELKIAGSKNTACDRSDSTLLGN